MQPAQFRQADFLLVEINNAKSTRPAVSSGEERGLLSRTAAGNRAYCACIASENQVLVHYLLQIDYGHCIYIF